VFYSLKSELSTAILNFQDFTCTFDYYRLVDFKFIISKILTVNIHFNHENTVN